MEFDIDIHTGLNGNITIEDYSYEYDQYFPENQIIQEYGRYKYNECKTLNVLVKINSGEIILHDVLLHEHDQLVKDPTNPEQFIYDLEKTHIKLKKDGYYKIHHLIIPTKEWFLKTYLYQNEEYKKAFEHIYIIDSDYKLYKYVENEFVECTVKEVIERNCDGTTIQKCIIDVFYTGFLQLCYINYCNKLFQKLINKCNKQCLPENIKEITYTRDFLWMVLNIIDYQISFKQYMEAQRILEMTNYCGSFCQNQELNAGPNTGCGCS